MRVVSQSELLPSQVLFAFDDVVDSAVRQVRWAVAYSTVRGCRRLIKRVCERMTNEQWARADKCFVTSLDFGLTDPGALDFLSSMPRSRVLIANPTSLERSGFAPKHAYHAKVYLFDSFSTTGYVVGSANLTESALLYNTETVITGKTDIDDVAWNDVWNALVNDTTALTPPLLSEYKRKRSRVSRRVVVADPKIEAPALVAPGLKTLADAIDAGTNPMAFEHLWIEAGSMLSGGLRNQLELPRGANRFFGFVHEHYENRHMPIGPVVLKHGERRWSDRPLAWHGDNGMERINLPTEGDGGMNYKHTAVLFRRESDGFELEALPWGDSGAIVWRAASAARKMLFRLGKRSNRLCGLF